jgi:hypothetical protein
MLKKLFKSEEVEKTIRLGRHSNYHTTENQNLAWNTAIDLYSAGDFLLSFKNLLEFLKQDNDQENLSYTLKDNLIEFILYQGSVKLTGKHHNNKLEVQAKLAEAKDLPEEMMLRLLQKNYEFEYVKYALNDANEILLVLNSGLADAQPNVVLRGLRELATQADKLDDLIASDFEKVDIVETTHTKELDSKIKTANTSFIKKQILELFEDIKAEEEIYEYHEFTKIYRIFNLVYAMDFLLTPQGQIMESLEIMHRELHNPEGKLAEKMLFFEQTLTSISEQKEKQLTSELYEVFYTFNLTPKINVNTLKEIIDNERQQLDWYKENGHDLVIQNIVGYVFGYCLFNYTLPAPIKKLIYFYYKCQYPDYFSKLDSIPFVDKNGSLIKKNIKKEVSKLTKSVQWTEAKLKASGRQKLDYENLTTFACSLLDFIYELDFIEYDD